MKRHRSETEAERKARFRELGKRGGKRSGEVRRERGGKQSEPAELSDPVTSFGSSTNWNAAAPRTPMVKPARGKVAAILDRVAQAAGKYGENAPAAAVCCNACRTCVTTNVIGLAMAGVVAAVAGGTRFSRRFAKPS